MTQPVDRRAFLQRAGVAGAAAGALWVAPSVIGTSSAFAGTSCINQFAFKFSTMTNGATVGNGTARAMNVVSGSGSHTLTVGTPVATGTTNPTSINNIAAFNSYGTQRYWLSMGSNHSVGVGWDVTFTFDVDMYNVTFTITDIDRAYNGADNYVDQVWLDGKSAANNPAPFGISNRGTYVGGGNGTSQSDAFVGTGTAASSDTDTTGSVTITFGGPVKTFTFHYFALKAGNGGGGYASPVSNQYVAIGDIATCS